jgi:hypothetical protein
LHPKPCTIFLYWPLLEAILLPWRLSVFDQLISLCFPLTQRRREGEDGRETETEKETETETEKEDGAGVAECRASAALWTAGN